MKFTTDHSAVQVASVGKWFVTTAAMAIVYFGAAKFGLGLAFANASASPVWPSTGVALAAMIVLGPHVWPGIWLGAFLVNMTNAGTLVTSISIATGNALEALVGGYLIHRFANGRRVFDRSEDVFKFTALAALMSTSVSATVGVTSLALAGFVDWAAYGAIWFTWWLGDAVGALIVTPLLVLWSTSPPLRWTRQRVFEATLLLLALILIGSFAFGDLFALKAQNYPLVFVCLPLLLWAAFRFGKHEATAASIVLSAIALWSTLRGFGPFVRESPNESLLLLQGFMGVVTITALILAAVVSEQQETENALRQSEQKFSTIFEKSAFAASLSSLPDGVLVNINEAFERAFGYTKQEAVGKTTLDLGINPDVDGRARILLALQAQGSARDQEMVLHTKSGEARVFSVNVDLVNIADHQYILNTIQDITERNRAEEQLRYQAYLLENINDAVIATDGNYVLKSWNPAAEKMYGWKAEEVIGRRGVDLLQTEFPNVDPAEMRRQIAETGRYAGEAAQLRKDGVRIPVEIASIVLKDQTGKPAGYVSVNRDIRERKQAEEQFYLAVESAPNAIVLVNKVGAISMVNAQTEKFFGYDRTELIGLNIDRLVPERYRANHAGFRAIFLSNPQTRSMGVGRDLYALHKDGREFLVEIGLTPIHTMHGLVVMATIVDITERKQAEEKLRESEQRYRTLVEQLPIMVYVNPADNISSTTYISPQIETFLGYNQTEWLSVSQFWSKALHAEDCQRVLAEVERADRSGEPFDVEYRLMAKDGNIVWVHDQAIRLSDPKGTPRFWQGIMIDLTERKQAEKEREAKLVLETKNAELDRFAYTVSHDLKSPLVTIKGFVGFLKRDIAVGDGERAQRDLNYIENAINKMQELLTGVLALSRAGLTIKEPEEIYYDDLIHNAIELLHGVLEANHVKVIIQPNLPIVLGDSLRLQQSLQNLIENAIKYRSAQRPPILEIGAQEKDETGQTILFVRDNGMGIPLEYQDRIFDVFSKVNAKTEGSGVGLATVKRIIEAHGGRIWVESEIEHGTTFYFTLPVK